MVYRLCLYVYVYISRDHHAHPTPQPDGSLPVALGGAQQFNNGPTGTWAVSVSVCAAVSGWCPVYREYMESI